MRNFILIVVSVVVLNVLTDLILCDGKMSKIVKSTISVFVFYMLVIALTELIKTAKFI